MTAGQGLLPATVLAQLAPDRAVSGSELARRLGVTRAAVWKQIERLRALGVPIDGAAGSGYRLQVPIELLDRKRILSALAPAVCARVADLALHWQLDSTSSELLRRSAGDPRDLLVCLAETQSAGRGRRGRAWVSPLAGNIYLSLLKRFSSGMGALSGLSLAVGVSVIQALADCGVAGAGLKWPNDLLAGGRKLAGILVELGGEFLGPCHAVVGIGINLRLPAAAAAAIDQPSVDLASLCGGTPPSRNLLAAALLTRLVADLDSFDKHGFAAFADAYAQYDMLNGRRVQVNLAAGVSDGIAAGVDARGALRVRHGARIAYYDSAEITVRAQ